MLNGIPKILSSDLMKLMMDMGNGDELVIGDGNFPGASLARNLIRLDGHTVPEVLEAILRLYPLDPYVKAPVTLMEVVPGYTVETPIWDVYQALCYKSAGKKVEIEHVERFAFYERAKKAYCVIMTGETALYANIILKKGVVTE